MCGRLLGSEERKLFDAVKRQEKQKKQAEVYFEQGYQAGSLPNGIKLKPNRASQTNQAAWLKGYHQGKRELEENELKKHVKLNQAGFKQMRDIVAGILK